MRTIDRMIDGWIILTMLHHIVTTISDRGKVGDLVELEELSFQSGIVDVLGLVVLMAVRHMIIMMSRVVGGGRVGKNHGFRDQFSKAVKRVELSLSLMRMRRRFLMVLVKLDER